MWRDYLLPHNFKILISLLEENGAFIYRLPFWVTRVTPKKVNKGIHWRLISTQDGLGFVACFCCLEASWGGLFVPLPASRKGSDCVREPRCCPPAQLWLLLQLIVSTNSNFSTVQYSCSLPLQEQR